LVLLFWKTNWLNECTAQLGILKEEAFDEQKSLIKKHLQIEEVSEIAEDYYIIKQAWIQSTQNILIQILFG
jgi:hypothetical protein